ncbi:hypothetical protein [Streptomyces sp. NPDC002690]
MSITIVFRIFDDDAAFPRPGIHAGADGTVRTEQPFQQGEVHAADEGREAFGDRVEGTVAHADDGHLPSCRPLVAAALPAAFQMRLVPTRGQQPQGLREAEQHLCFSSGSMTDLTSTSPDTE